MPWSSAPGPAGSTAAFRLARAGARVLLVDKARFPRDKPCGGGLTVRAVRLLPFSVAPVVEEEVDVFELGLGYRRRFVRRTAAPLVVMTQRRRLDAFLVEQAQEAGAEFRDGATADGIDATVVIGADGVNGSFARSAGHVHEVALEAQRPLRPRLAPALRTPRGRRVRDRPGRLRLGLPEGRPRQRRRRGLAPPGTAPA